MKQPRITLKKHEISLMSESMLLMHDSLDEGGAPGWFAHNKAGKIPFFSRHKLRWSGTAFGKLAEATEEKVDLVDGYRSIVKMTPLDIIVRVRYAKHALYFHAALLKNRGEDWKPQHKLAKKLQSFLHKHKTWLTAVLAQVKEKEAS